MADLAPISPDVDHDGIPPAPFYPDPQHDLSGGLPMNLNSLRDGPPGTKPFYPYSTLIRYAIKGSPNQRLLLEDIYYAIETRFPYFVSAPPGWKNSVRHNLSLNPCFEKVARPLTDRGKGSYWTVNDNVDPRTGVHRVRKKRSNKSSTAAAAAAGTYRDDGDFGEGTFDPDLREGSPGGVYDHAQFDHTGEFMVEPEPFTMDGELSLAIEVDRVGNPNWRNMWLNELAKLQHVTAAQEKTGAGEDWYRIMVTRVRGAFMPADAMALEGVEGNDEPSTGLEEA